MAWGVKYSKKFQKVGINTTYKVDILKNDWVSPVIVPDRMGVDPFLIKTLAAEKDEDKIVIGSEASFEFVLKKRAGESAYDDLFNSEYRDHIVKFYNDDTSTLLWQGYLQPENMSKDIFESNMHIYLSATDALKDLSTFDFLDVGKIVSERKKGLEIIKIALSNLGFEYDFVVKQGMRHTGQGPGSTPIADITHDTRRFANVKDGKTEIDDCLTVIEKILKPYSCTLRQWMGKYYIQYKYEGDTVNYTYPWASSIPTITPATDGIDLSSYTFSRGAEVSKLSPVKELGIKLLNRNIGGDLVPGINIYTEPAGNWDYSNWKSVKNVTDPDYMQLTAQNATGAPISNGFVTLGSNVTIQKLTDGDYLKLRFTYRGTNPNTDPNTWPEFKITVVKNGSDYEEYSSIKIISTPMVYESYASANFKLLGNIGEAYNYNIKIEIFSQFSNEDFPIQLSNFNLTRASIVDDENIDDITFDSYSTGTISKGKIKKEIELYFGDSIMVTDFAALYWSTNVTSQWNRIGEIDNKSLLYLLAKDYLISRQGYTEYIMIDVKDTGDNITPVNFIEWNSKIYNIVSYEKSFRSSWVKLHLKQRLTADIAVGWEVTRLTSVDGQSSGGSTPYTPSIGGDSSWPSITSKPSWITGATDVGQNLVTLANPSAIAFIRINAGNTVDALSAVLFKAALALQNVTNESKATMFTNPVFTGNTVIPLLFGSVAANGDIIIEGTSHATKTTSYVILQPTGGATLIGKSSRVSGRALEVGSAGLYVGGNIEFPKGSTVYMGSTNDTGTRLNFKQDIPTNNCFIDYYIDLIFRSGLNSSVINAVLKSTGEFALHRGGLHIGGTTDAGNDNLLVDGTGKFVGNVSQPSYTAGWFGNNWQIAQNGDVEFENLLVRGSARFRELIIDQLSVIGGSNLMSIARGKVASINTGDSKVTLDDPNNKGACQFAVNDFFWIKTVDINNTLFTDCKGQISAISGVTLTLDFSVTGASGTISNVNVGDVIVQRGHPTTVGRQNMIYTTVSDTNNPFRRILTGINSLAAFNNLSNISLQDGNLASLASHDIVPSTPGYGLYSDNVYLSGSIVANSGVIGGWNIGTGATKSLYTGTEKTTDGFSVLGITIAANGGLHSPNLFINTDGGVGIRGKQIIYSYNSNSYSVIFDNASVVANTRTAPEIAKHLVLPSTCGYNQKIRISFSLKTSAGGIAYGRIYRNGTAVGTTQSNSTGNYITMYEEITGWNSGDRIELYIWNGVSLKIVSNNSLSILGQHTVIVKEMDNITGGTD